MVKWKYIGSLLRFIYIYVQSVKTYNRIVHEYKCLFLAFILLQTERESGKQNLGVKEKCSQSYLSYFLTGFHWRIFFFHGLLDFVLFFSTGLKDFGVPRVSVNLLSLARSKMAMVRLPRALPKNCLFTIYFRWGEGNPHFRLGSPPIIWLLSLSPSDVRRPEFTKCEHLVYILRDLHSLLTVTFWLLDTLIQYGRIVSVLPLRLRELSRDNLIYMYKEDLALN